MFSTDLKIEKNILKSPNKNIKKSFNYDIFEKEFSNGINVERFNNDNTLNLPKEVDRVSSPMIMSMTRSYNSFKYKTQIKKFRPVSNLKSLEMLSENGWHENNTVSEFNRIYRSEFSENKIEEKLIFEKLDDGNTRNIVINEINEISTKIQSINNSPRYQKEIFLEDTMHNVITKSYSNNN
jgi:hypothetical protein